MMKSATSGPINKNKKMKDMLDILALQSKARYLCAIDSIIRKYENLAQQEDIADEIDLNNLEIAEDRGFVRQIEDGRLGFISSTRYEKTPEEKLCFKELKLLAFETKNSSKNLHSKRKHDYKKTKGKASARLTSNICLASSKSIICNKDFKKDSTKEQTFSGTDVYKEKTVNNSSEALNADFQKTPIKETVINQIELPPWEEFLSGSDKKGYLSADNDSFSKSPTTGFNVLSSTKTPTFSEVDKYKIVERQSENGLSIICGSAHKQTPVEEPNILCDIKNLFCSEKNGSEQDKEYKLNESKLMRKVKDLSLCSQDSYDTEHTPVSPSVSRTLIDHSRLPDPFELESSFSKKVHNNNTEFEASYRDNFFNTSFSDNDISQFNHLRSYRKIQWEYSAAPHDKNSRDLFEKSKSNCSNLLTFSSLSMKGNPHSQFKAKVENDLCEKQYPIRRSKVLESPDTQLIGSQNGDNNTELDSQIKLDLVEDVLTKHFPVNECSVKASNNLSQSYDSATETIPNHDVTFTSCSFLPHYGRNLLKDSESCVKFIPNETKNSKENHILSSCDIVQCDFSPVLTGKSSGFDTLKSLQKDRGKTQSKPLPSVTESYKMFNKHQVKIGLFHKFRSLDESGLIHSLHSREINSDSQKTAECIEISSKIPNMINRNRSLALKNNISNSMLLKSNSSVRSDPFSNSFSYQSSKVLEHCHLGHSFLTLQDSSTEAIKGFSPSASLKKLSLHTPQKRELSTSKLKTNDSLIDNAIRMSPQNKLLLKHARSSKRLLQ
ncbi:uncharacterized protein LOC143236973 [Tachypleus tridentatus]|uniref:uncharacterized protein LOC143236973 n=1 Tax=Tachypleus tridentatus TaxID=6853 RepID=UPI003FD389B3